MYYPREAERDFLFTRATLAFFLIIPSLIMVLLSKGGGIPYAAIKASPLEEIGTITNIEIGNKYHPRTVIYYSFKIDDNKQVTGEYIQNKQNDNSEYLAGQKIRIIYSALLPRFHVVRASLESNSPDFYIFSTGIGLILLCLIFISWTISKIIKHKEEDHYY
jgi:hypothetical protein